MVAYNDLAKRGVSTDSILNGKFRDPLLHAQNRSVFRYRDGFILDSAADKIIDIYRLRLKANDIIN